MGFEAIKTLLASSFASSGCQLILLARDENEPRIQAAKQRLVDQVSKLKATRPGLTVQLQRMDLADLTSVRSTAYTLTKQLQCKAGRGTDVFLLNAAVAKASRQTVIDQDRAHHRHPYLADAMTNDADSSVETTACVNHIAHLLFIKLLLPTIMGNAVHGRKTRLVFTGSALHRSLKQTDTLDTLFGASGSCTTPWTLRESYAASKFLQMLGIRALRRRMDDYVRNHGLNVPTGAVEIVVVQPGFVPQTGLSRESSLIGRIAMTYLLPWAPFATRLEDAGEYIAKACYVDLDQASQVDAENAADGFSSADTIVRGALLEVKNKQQQFGEPDIRTADIELQEKWWPCVCGD